MVRLIPWPFLLDAANKNPTKWLLGIFLMKEGKMNKKEWLDPTPEMLESEEFNAIWQVIKTWDINVPEVYEGYCGANGNHVRAILDGLNLMKGEK